VDRLVVPVECSAAESLRTLAAFELLLHFVPRSYVIFQRMLRTFTFTTEGTQEANDFEVLHLHVFFESWFSAIAVTTVIAEVGLGVSFEMTEKFIAVGEDFVASLGEKLKKRLKLIDTLEITT
jgi:hypothetical protein